MRSFKKRCRGTKRQIESLEYRQMLSGDGLTLGPLLQEFPEAVDRAEEIATQLHAESANAVSIEFEGFASLTDSFETAEDVDFFKITTPGAEDGASPSNGFLNLSAFAYATGSPTIAVVGDEAGEPIYATVAFAPFFGVMNLELEPATTYTIAVGQFYDPDYAFEAGNPDLVGQYQLDISYYLPTPPPPEPSDVEPDTPSEAPLLENAPLEGYLNSNGDIDYFAFTATQDGVLNVVLEAGPPAIAELRLESADGMTLSSELAFFGPVELLADVEAGETYFVSLRADVGQGTYSLFAFEGEPAEPNINPVVIAEDRHGDTLETATDLTDFGPFVFEFGVINSSEDVDVFKKTIAAPTDIGVAASSNDLVFFELLDESGTVLQTLDPDGALPTTVGPGDIYLRVRSNGEAPAEYNFFYFEDASATGLIVEEVAIPDETEGSEVPPVDAVGDTAETAEPFFDLIALGIEGLWAAQGQLDGFTDDGLLDVDVFSVRLDEGEALLETATISNESEVELLFSVFDATGEVIAETSTAEGAVDLTILSSGEYFVQVSSAAESFAEFEIYIQQFQDPIGVFEPIIEPEPLDPNLFEPQPIEPTLEELAELLGIDVSDLTGVPTEPVMIPNVDEPNSAGVTPEIISVEELAALLGLDPDLFFVPEIEESTDDDVNDDTLLASLVDPLMGDVDGDQHVGFLDFLTLSEYYGTTEGAEWLHGNFDDDGDVDFHDFLVLSANYGEVA